MARITCSSAIIVIDDLDAVSPGAVPASNWDTTTVVTDRLRTVEVRRNASKLTLTIEETRTLPGGALEYRGTLTGEGAWNSLTCDQEGVRLHLIGACEITTSIHGEPSTYSLDGYLSQRRNFLPLQEQR